MSSLTLLFSSLTNIDIIELFAYNEGDNPESTSSNFP